MQCQPARRHSSTRPRRTIAVAGACVRQFAQSLRRGGLDVVSIDDFADWDTRLCGPAVRLRDRRGLADALAPHSDVVGLVICGGFEQHPEAVQWALSQHQIPLLGNAISTDKWEVIERAGPRVEQAGMIVPPVRRRPPTDAGPWLRKPNRSAGGAGIQVWRNGAMPRGNCTPDRSRDQADNCYFQRFVPGLPASALYISDSTKTRLVGVCLLIEGQSIPHAINSFGTFGAIGPVILSEPMTEILKRGGASLAETFELRGLWGIDLILGEDDRIHFIELNPRPTSTMDLYEVAGVSESLMYGHVNCFQAGDFSLSQTTCVWAKSVAFWPGPEPLSIDQRLHEWLCEQANWNASSFLGDIPMSGEIIVAGQPLVTVYVRARRATETETETVSRLPWHDAFDAVSDYAARILDNIRNEGYPKVGSDATKSARG